MFQPIDLCAGKNWSGNSEFLTLQWKGQACLDLVNGRLKLLLAFA